MQSCRYAMSKGADSLEIDLCMTSDGKIILWHDWDPDETVAITRQEGNPSENAFKPHVPGVGSDWRRPTIDLALVEFREHYTHMDQSDAVDSVKRKVEFPDIDLVVPTLAEFMSEIHRLAHLRCLCLDIKMPAEASDRTGEMMDGIFSSLPKEFSFVLIVMVPDLLVLQKMKQRAEEKQYGMKFTWDIEFPPGLVLIPSKYSAIDHATGDLHNSVASVGRPVAIPFSWTVYRDTIKYDIREWNKVNADPGIRNAGHKIDFLITWTIDIRKELSCLADMGVSGIITDKPELLASVVGRS
jgi:glycerophosphoryl diester phosphodiesterase